MNNLPRQKLLEIVRRHGREIITEPRRCEGLMRDNFPAHRREIAVLTAALEARIPAELLAPGASSMPRGALLLARHAARLQEDVAMEASAARWAVHTWALALGVITPAELDTLEQADGRADGQTARSSRRQETEPTRAHSQQQPPPQQSPPPQPPPPAAPSRAPAHAGSPRAGSAAPSSAPTARTSFVVAADGSGDFLTLTDAIRRVPAGAGLVVRPGIYDEGVVLDKSLEIVGDGPLEEIVVRATASSCIVMRADTATIRHLTLRGQAGGAGGDFFAVDIPHGRLLLDDCDISSDSLACVAIHNPTAAPIIRACRIHHGADSGVFAFDGARGVIETCDVSAHANIGIAITGGATTGVRDSRIHHGADAGVVVWERAANVIEGCDIYANRRTNVGASDAGTTTLRRCRIHDGENTGVFIHRDGRATFEECDIYAHAEAEVAVTGGGDARLSRCRIHDGRSHGLFVGDAGRALLEACDVLRNRESGIHVDAGGGAVAHACRINDNGHVAVNCEAGGSVEVEGCDLTRNRIAAWQSDHGSLVTGRNNRL